MTQRIPTHDKRSATTPPPPPLPSPPKVITLYTGGLDFSGPVEEYFISNSKSVVDTCINLTGFALVGGPASQDHAKAVSTLQKLNVPYLCTVPLVFQSFEEWQASELGLHPIQVALQVRRAFFSGFVVGGRYM